jgi:hypothetical protein
MEVQPVVFLSFAAFTLQQLAEEKHEDTSRL